ncbi:hypothetical protein KSW81_008153 [Nannochloris sp. 'desiccata']|nr:hypothetical protein KSW81_008153 [Chlorella desiccata (nom. nud.)]
MFPETAAAAPEIVAGRATSATEERRKDAQPALSDDKSFSFRPKPTRLLKSTTVSFLPGYKGKQHPLGIRRPHTLHSQFNVLQYTYPVGFSLLPGGLVDVETTWWTPLLFGVAGVIIGVGLNSLDSYFDLERKFDDNAHAVGGDGGGGLSWSWVILGISAFVLQYWLSAVLESPLLGVNFPGTSLPAEDVILAIAAVGSFFIFDMTPQGFFIAALTAVSGPAVELLLISQGLYHYAHPVLFNAVPTWILWTYFAGGPAVGNLGRKTAQILMKSYSSEIEKKR